MVTYITKEDLDNFEEKLIDHTFNRLKLYYRILGIYDNVDKTWLEDIDILEGDKNYGK